MDWTQTLTIIATVVSTGYYIHREIQQDIRAANARTDKLYEMFISLLQAKNEK
jgi:Ni,Fe-hydrogenase I cytochrome b subunit